MDNDIKTIIEVMQAEAWVVTMQLHSNSWGTLYVTSHIKINMGELGQKMVLKKKYSHCNSCSILILEVLYSNYMMDMFNPQHVTYSEKLIEPNQYNYIELIFNNRKISEIQNIPVIR